MPLAKKKTTQTSVIVEKNSLLWWKKNWILFMMIVLSLFMLGLFIVFMYIKFTETKPIAKYVPLESTIAFVSFHPNLGSADIEKLNTFFAGSGSGSLVQRMTGLSDEEYKSMSKDWLGETAGIALFAIRGKNIPVMFMSTKEKEKGLHFFVEADAKKELYEGYTLYETKKFLPLFVTLIDNYIVVSSDKEGVTAVLDVSRGANKALYYGDVYPQVIKNLPNDPLLFAYADYAKGLNVLKKALSFSHAYREILKLFSPLETHVSALAFALLDKDNGYDTKVFVLGDPTFFAPLENPKRYPSQFALHVTDNTLWYVGGFNLLERSQGFLTALSNTYPDAEIILEGLANYELQKYIVSQHKLSDFYDLGMGEYGIFYGSFNGKKNQGLVAAISLKNELGAEDLMKQVFEDFKNNSELLYTPQIRDLVLPDETVGKEIYLVPRDLKEVNSPYRGGTIHYLSIEGDTFSPGYYIADGMLYVFSQKDVLDAYVNDDAQGRKKELLEGHMRGAVHMGNLVLTMVDDCIDPMCVYLSKKLGMMSWGINFFDRGLVFEGEMAINTVK